MPLQQLGHMWEGHGYQKKETTVSPRHLSPPSLRPSQPWFLQEDWTPSPMVGAIAPLIERKRCSQSGEGHPSGSWDIRPRLGSAEFTSLGADLLRDSTGPTVQGCITQLCGSCSERVALTFSPGSKQALTQSASSSQFTQGPKSQGSSKSFPESPAEGMCGWME